MIPLYGFLEGDTIGLLVLADEQDSIARLADRLQDAAAVRVARRSHVRVFAKGGLLELGSTVAEAGLQALDRFDVTPAGAA